MFSCDLDRFVVHKSGNEHLLMKTKTYKSRSGVDEEQTKTGDCFSGIVFLVQTCIGTNKLASTTVFDEDKLIRI